jgi:hypothetical protein
MRIDNDFAITQAEVETQTGDGAASNQPVAILVNLRADREEAGGEAPDYLSQ